MESEAQKSIENIRGKWQELSELVTLMNGDVTFTFLLFQLEGAGGPHVSVTVRLPGSHTDDLQSCCP